MASIIYRPKDIFEQEFKVVMRGFDKSEVDEFLDNVIHDYELFLAEIDNLKAENAQLKARVQELEETGVSEMAYKQPPFDENLYGQAQEPARMTSAATNFDILKRISRLEREVFGKKITE